jgi:hypothetical protein
MLCGHVEAVGKRLYPDPCRACRILSLWERKVFERGASQRIIPAELSGTVVAVDFRVAVVSDLKSISLGSAINLSAPNTSPSATVAKRQAYLLGTTG